jgi:hypothetical protein
MTTEIREASLEARIQKQLQATGPSSVEEVLLRSLENLTLPALEVRFHGPISRGDFVDSPRSFSYP